MSRKSVLSSRRSRDIDLPLLADQVMAALGRVVTVELSETDSGVAVRLFNPDNDDPVDYDEAAVLALLAAHVKPPDEPDLPDPLDTLAAALDGATTVAALRGALTEYVAGEQAVRGGVRPERGGSLAGR